MKSLCSTIILFGMGVFCDGLTSSDERAATAITHTYSLSTAKQLSSTSPRPSSLYRRINVERVEEITSSPLDLFLVRDPERRSQMESVWKWDFWCQLQPKMGNCTSELRQQQQGGPRQNFYYDAQLDTCVPFTYSGCEGNKNNFQTSVDCERHCKGSAYMPLKDSKRTTYCSLQPNAGLCMALLQRYYYDVNGDDCKTFIYGGCGGNQNRFKTKALCTQRCKDEEY